MPEDAEYPTGTCRGLVQDFPSSAIAKQSKASRYLKASPKKQQSMRDSAKESCTFCSAPLFALPGNVFFQDNLVSPEDSYLEQFDRGSSPEDFEMVTGRVCGNGHLTFAIVEVEDCLHVLERKPLAGTGEQMRVDTFKVFDVVVEALSAGPLEKELDSESEAGLRKNMNAFTVAAKIRRLANETEYETSDEEDTLEGLSPLPRLETMPELISGIPEIARRTCEVIKDFVDCCEAPSESKSGSESEGEEQCQKVHPFWEVPVDEIETVMAVLEAVPTDSVGILATDLSRKMLSARRVLRMVRILRRLDSLGEQATQRLGAMEAHRKAVIEAALKEAGVRRRGGAWPIPEAVFSLVKDPDMSLEETVNRERQRWLEMEEKRAAERAAQKRETAKRKAAAQGTRS